MTTDRLSMTLTMPKLFLFAVNQADPKARLFSEGTTSVFGTPWTMEKAEILRQ